MYAYSSRRSVDYQKIVISTLSIAVVITGGVIGYSYGITKNIKEMEASKGTISQAIEDTKTQMIQLEEDNTAKAKEIETIENTLWRYEPIVIPDSMK